MRDKKLIQMYITNRCNSRCKTCGIWKNKENEAIDFTYNFLKIFNAFPHADYVIGGGEAILHNKIDSILEYAREMKINYTLLSNCVWPEKLMRVVEEHCVPAVTVSFDGLNHDEIRGVPGNMRNIIEFKEWCYYNDVHVKVSYTYSKYNENSFKEDMNFIKEKLGFNEIYFCIAQDMSLLETAEADEIFIAKNFEQILECDLIPIKDRNHIKCMVNGTRKCCTSQNNVHTVYSNGNIVRCQSFMSKEILGNISNMSVEQIRNVLNSVENKRCAFDTECNLLCQRRYD